MSSSKQKLNGTCEIFGIDYYYHLMILIDDLLKKNQIPTQNYNNKKSNQ